MYIPNSGNIFFFKVFLITDGGDAALYHYVMKKIGLLRVMRWLVVGNRRRSLEERDQ